MTPPRDDSPSTVAASPEIVTVHHVSGAWRLRADWRGRLLAAGVPDWFRLHDDRRAALVKQGRGRSVWRVELGETVVFAKVVQPGSGLQRVKALVLGDPARREWDALKACAARGVPVPEAIGWGSQSGSRSRVLITQAIEPAQTLLDAWMTATKSPADRRTRTIPLMHAAATLFATAHERGVWHRDAHAGNILVGAIGAECRAYFTDLLGAKFRRGALDWKESMQSLAQFDQRMRRVATRVERRALLREYLNLRRPREVIARGELRALLEEKRKSQWCHAQRLAQQWDRRLRGDGKYFAHVRLGGGWRGIVVLRLERRPPDTYPRIDDRTLNEWHETLPQLVLAQPSEGAFVPARLEFEHLQARTLRERLSWTLHGSPTRNLFYDAHRGRHRDLHWKPMLLGYLERRRWGFVDACVLLHPIEVTGLNDRETKE